jgi:E3 ubiquitin-protein ligase HUWE1
MIGTAMDELIRHHPSLKHSVMAALTATLDKIEQLGLESEIPEDIKNYYELVPDVPISAAQPDRKDVDMAEAPGDGANITSEEPRVASPPMGTKDAKDEEAGSYHENSVVAYIDTLGRVSHLKFSFLSKSDIHTVS